MSCQGCPNRFLYCHSICDDYINAKKERERLSEINRSENIWTISRNRIKYMDSKR